MSRIRHSRISIANLVLQQTQQLLQFILSNLCLFIQQQQAKV